VKVSTVPLPSGLSSLVLQHGGRVQLGDLGVHHGAVALVVGVQPAQHDPPTVEVYLGLGQPADQLGRIGDRLPDPFDRVREPPHEAQNLLAVLRFKYAIRGHAFEHNP
jgi:hypothetical protein